MHEDNVHCASEASDDEYDAGESLVLGVMKTAMNDIFMHDQQPGIAMITRSSP